MEIKLYRDGYDDIKKAVRELLNELDRNASDR